MATAELLAKVKTGLLITSAYQDEMLGLYIDETIAFLADAGVAVDVLESDQVYGVILRGVIDLWNFGQGAGKLSDYFIQRAVQLKYKVGD